MLWAGKDHGRDRGESGVAATEMALLLLLIAAFAFTAVAFFGGRVSNLLDEAPPAFQPRVTVTSVGQPGGGGGGQDGGGGGKIEGMPKEQFCKLHPADLRCLEDDDGGGEDNDN